MAKILRWRNWAGILKSEGPKSPWGSGSGGGNGNGGGGDGGDGGPRNPWAFPPQGKKSRAGVTSLDEFLKRARGGGGGSGGGPGGSRFPTAPGGPRLWVTIGGGLLLLWIVFTSVHSIGAQQLGVVTTLGRFSDTLTTGIRVTLPAPFAQVTKVDVGAIREEQFPENGSPNLMLTSDQSIVDLAYQVRWRVADPQDYLFQIAEPREMVRATAESAMRAVVATATLDETIGPGRDAISLRVRELLQQILDEYNSGIRIEGVEIKNAAAPTEVEEDFKQVTAAQQEAQAALNDARAYAQRAIAKAQGEAAQFDKIYEQYRLAPEVTRRRLYYETMERVLARSNKTIVETDGVVPYLPLPETKRSQPAPAEKAQPQQQGGGQ